MSRKFWVLSVDNLQEGVFIIFCLLLTTAISHHHCHWRRDRAFVEKKRQKGYYLQIPLAVATSLVMSETSHFLVDLEKKLVPTCFIIGLFVCHRVQRASHLFQDFFGFYRIILLKISFPQNRWRILGLELEAFWFHISLLEKEWNLFFHFVLLEKEWRLFSSLCISRKRVKAFIFHFSLPELPRPNLAGAWLSMSNVNV